MYIMQNFILIVLAIGLGFFLYLIKIGEIDSDMFDIRNLQGSVRFETVQIDATGMQKSEILRLNIKNNPHDIYNFSGIDFKHIPRSEYYMKIYNIPLEAKDAVTGIWLGLRYNFYVIEEPINNGSESGFTYRVYKAEYPTDSVEPATYIVYKLIQNLDIKNTLDVRY